VPTGNCAEQIPLLVPSVIVQLMPVTELVMVPDPLPAGVTVSSSPVGRKVAVTDSAWLTVMVHSGLVPVQLPPVQPTKYEPVCGVAVSVTCWAWSRMVEQVPVWSVPSWLQAIPLGVLVTVPPVASGSATVVTVIAWVLVK